MVAATMQTYAARIGFNPAEGQILGGRYRLNRLLGEGGMGVIWAATQLSSGQEVAVKLSKKDAPFVSTEQQYRLLQEVRAAGRVKHPNVVQLIDVVDLSNGGLAIVMELLVGESLQDRLDRKGKLPISELCCSSLQVVSAMMAVHRCGIVHRDLKPENIFIAQTGEEEVVKVLDFGIAKLFAAGTDPLRPLARTASGVRLGTFHYMSPEQANAEADIDYRSDIWSFGLVLYRGLSGVLPTGGARSIEQLLKLVKQGLQPVAEVAPEIPAELASVVDRTLRLSRDDRPDWGEIRRVLERCAAGRGATEKHDSSSRGIPLGVFASLALALAAGFVLRDLIWASAQSTLWATGAGIEGTVHDLQARAEVVFKAVEQKSSPGASGDSGSEGVAPADPTAAGAGNGRAFLPSAVSTGRRGTASRPLFSQMGGAPKSQGRDHPAQKFSPQRKP